MTEPTDTPEPTETLKPTKTPELTETPSLVYRTYTSSEDFNEGQLSNVTGRIKDQLVLEDRKVGQSMGSLQNVYGEKQEPLYIEVTQSMPKSILMPSDDKIEVNVGLKGIGDPLVIEREPIDLVVAIDDSVSMEWGNIDDVMATPNRQDHAKEA